MGKTKEEQTIQWAKQKKDRQYNGQSKRKTDNTMIKTKEEHTIQWAKQKKDRQYNDQNKRKTDNALVLVKTKEEQTIQ
jgi:hypothetical protein